MNLIIEEKKETIGIARTEIKATKKQYPTIESFMESIKGKPKSFKHDAIFKFLEDNYAKYNRREDIHPDPLEFLYQYKNPQDIEIVGLLSSSLAYGRVSQILKSVQKVLDPMRQSSPRSFIENHSKKDFRSIYSSFKHRFTGSEDLVKMLVSIKKMIEKYGSIERAFLSFYDDTNYLKGVSDFTHEFGVIKSFFPDPMQSTCKRLHLYLRWMIRSDKVDLGIWKKIPTKNLYIPVDTHMLSLYSILSQSGKVSSGLNTAKKIRDFFAVFNPLDPCKYDFSLTRFGIHKTNESLLHT